MRCSPFITVPRLLYVVFPSALLPGVAVITRMVVASRCSAGQANPCCEDNPQGPALPGLGGRLGSSDARAGLAAVSPLLSGILPLLSGILPLPCPPELLRTCGTSDQDGGAWLELRRVAGGCGTPSLALALLAPQSCRFQVALRRGKDNPQGCLRAAR